MRMHRAHRERPSRPAAFAGLLQVAGVEKPLHGARRPAVALQPLAQGEAGAQRITAWMSQPFRGVLEGPEAVGFMKSANMLLIDPGMEDADHQGRSPCRTASFSNSAEEGLGFVWYLCGKTDTQLLRHLEQLAPLHLFLAALDLCPEVSSGS